MKKKLLALLLALVMTIGLAACGSGDNPGNENSQTPGNENSQTLRTPASPLALPMRKSP